MSQCESIEQRRPVFFFFFVGWVKKFQHKGQLMTIAKVKCHAFFPLFCSSSLCVKTILQLHQLWFTTFVRLLFPVNNYCATIFAFAHQG